MLSNHVATIMLFKTTALANDCVSLNPKYVNYSLIVYKEINKHKISQKNFLDDWYQNY